MWQQKMMSTLPRREVGSQASILEGDTRLLFKRPACSVLFMEALATNAHSKKT